MPISGNMLRANAIKALSTQQSQGQTQSQTPAEALAAFSERGMDRFNADYMPVINTAIGSLDDTSLIDTARQNADAGFQGSPGRLQRNLGRYGVHQGEVDLRESNIGFQMARSLAGTNAVNNARLDQFDRNRAIQNELIGVGRGVANDAYQGFANSAAIQESRDASNRQASAAGKAQRIGMAGSIASAAVALL